MVGVRVYSEDGERAVWRGEQPQVGEGLIHWGALMGNWSTRAPGLVLPSGLG